MQIDQAVAKAVLEALTPAALEASLEARRAAGGRSRYARLLSGASRVERARYEAERAERRYRSVEPENRLVARGLEAEWDKRLRELDRPQSELAAREQQRARALDPAQVERIRALGVDLKRVWSAPTTRTATASSCCARCSKR